jgi:hypothetical protein
MVYRRIFPLGPIDICKINRRVRAALNASELGTRQAPRIPHLGQLSAGIDPLRKLLPQQRYAYVIGATCRTIRKSSAK